jgi:hypothetical protein
VDQDVAVGHIDPLMPRMRIADRYYSDPSVHFVLAVRSLCQSPQRQLGDSSSPAYTKAALY